MQLSIIIVTYNSAKYIRECLQSISQTMGELKSEIIIIDNNSTDQTLELVQYSGNLHIIKNDSNMGFAAAVNQGIEQSQGDLILLLNPDTETEKNSLQKLINFIQSDRKVGIAGSRVLNPDKTLQYSIGRFPTVINLIIDRIPFLNTIFPAYFERRHRKYQNVQYPDWAAGPYLLIKREVIEKVGGFDEDYFMYMEEVDLCYRARKAGWRTAFCPDAEVIHYDLGKSEKNRYNKTIYQRLGLLLFFKKFYSSLRFNRIRQLLKIELVLFNNKFQQGEPLDKYKKSLEG